LARHVGLALAGSNSSPDTTEAEALLGDLGERIFAAILCLSTGLRTLTVRCPPCDATHAAVAPRYERLSSLIESALNDNNLGGTTLRYLELVHLAGYPRSLRRADMDRAVSYVRADACPGLLLPPSVIELRVSAVTGGWCNRAITPNIRHASAVTNDLSSSLAAFCESPRWTLTELRFSLLGRRPSGGAAICDAWLSQQARNLKLLDICEMEYHWQDHRLRSLSYLRQLEYLRIPLQLLASLKELRGGLPLHQTLPPRIKTLHINHPSLPSAASTPFDFATTPSGIAAHLLLLPVRNTALGAALCDFALSCQRTHPRLKSIIVQGKQLPVRGAVNAFVFHGDQLRELRDAFVSVGVSLHATDES